MKKLFPISTLIFLLFFSCNGPSGQDVVPGAWTVSSYVDTANPDFELIELPKDTAIVFYDDGTFRSDSSIYGIRTGKWAVVDDEDVLYLFGDGEYDDSKWSVKIGRNSMTWTGIEPQVNRSLKIVHQKIKKKK